VRTIPKDPQSFCGAERLPLEVFNRQAFCTNWSEKQYGILRHCAYCIENTRNFTLRLIAYIQYAWGIVYLQVNSTKKVLVAASAIGANFKEQRLLTHGITIVIGT